MIIRLEGPDDVEAIRDVVGRAFAEASHSDGTEPAIVDALRAAKALTLSLVVIDGTELVGHVAVSRVQPEKADGAWFGLGPVSVRPDRQMQGIGSTLIREALDRLRTAGAAGCVVLGDPTYYGRFGFEHDPAATYRDVPPPYFQLLSLNGQRATGPVEYHPAFEASN